MRLPLHVFAVFLLTLLPGGAARAAESSVVGAEEPRRPFLGVSLGAGVPEGASLSLAVRPWYWLRFHGGVMNNAVSTGFQGGVSLVPFYSWLTPALTLEAGRFRAGDENGLARRLTGNVVLDDPLLRRVGYDFGSAYLGLEIGSPRVVSFFVGGGLSYVESKIYGLGEQVGGRSEASDLQLCAVTPSAKLGLRIYFL